MENENMATKKECFIEEIIKLLADAPENYFSPDALDFWNGLQAGGDEPLKFTKTGALALKYMQENKDSYNNLFKAKDIGEGLTLSTRAVTGSLRKLVNDGYCEKVGQNPIIYSLTTKGKEAEVEIGESVD
jgi:DNA-binding MarR family transcriptional regulator